MFYYSANALSQLGTTRSLFASSAQRGDEICTEDTIFKISRFVKPIIKVEKISSLLSSNLDITKFYLLLLNDSQSRSFGLVREEALRDIIVSNYVPSSGWKSIEENHVIMVYEYMLISQSNQLLRDDEIAYFMSSFDDVDNLNKELPLLVLENFLIIGKDTPIAERILSTSTETKKEAASSSHQHESDDKQAGAILSISSLSSSMSNQNWTIKSCLSKISPVKDFPYKKGDFGRVMRMQFYDRTGYIEVVFFNEFIDRYIGFFEIGKCYFIRNSEIKYSKKSYRAWPDDLYSSFDIIVNKTSVFQIAEDEIILKSEIAPPPSSASLEQQLQNHKLPAQTMTNTQQQQQQKKSSSFISLNELILKKNKCLVDVIGVVCDIGEMDTINRVGKKTTLFIKRIKVVDATSDPVSVAFWGQQASELNVKIGDIYMFKGAELTSYGGLSLNVLRTTGFIKITGYYNVEGVEQLAMWWRKEKSNYIVDNVVVDLSNNSPVKGSNKRDREKDDDDDEDEDCNTNKRFKQG